MLVNLLVLKSFVNNFRLWRKLFLFIPTLLFSYSFELTTNDYNIIEQSPLKHQIRNRINDYREFVKLEQNSAIERKLCRVNFYINQILPELDCITCDDGDYWMSPKEFLIIGKGDCEDYAIAKYFTLIELDIDKRDLYLSIVKVEGSSNYHMVLLYNKDRNSEILVLDNLSFRVLPLGARRDLTPLVAMNEFGYFSIKDAKIDTQIKLNIIQWQELLDKVYKQNR